MRLIHRQMPERPMEETPDYLHFKHKYGFLANFTQLYQAFFWSCKQREIEISHKRCDKFFTKLIENLGLDVEFKQANIDPRSFTLEIEVEGGATAVHHNINAGRLLVINPTFIPLIALKGFTECSITLNGIKNTLTLEE